MRMFILSGSTRFVLRIGIYFGYVRLQYILIRIFFVALIRLFQPIDEFSVVWRDPV